MPGVQDASYASCVYSYIVVYIEGYTYPSVMCVLLVNRREHSIPQLGEVAEAAPVPDLLGSILSGQSLLLMDSSDVVINRDGSLKAPKSGKFYIYLCIF